MGSEQKFLAPRKIEVYLDALDGTQVHLEVEKISGEMMKAITDTAQEDKLRKDPHGGLCQQMAIYFGGKAKEYSERFDARVIKACIEWMNEQLRNPT